MARIKTKTTFFALSAFRCLCATFPSSLNLIVFVIWWDHVPIARPCLSSREFCTRITTSIGIWAPGSVCRAHGNTHVNAVDDFNIIKVTSFFCQCKLSLSSWLAEATSGLATTMTIAAAVSSSTIRSFIITACSTSRDTTPNDIKVLG